MFAEHQLESNTNFSICHKNRNKFLLAVAEILDSEIFENKITKTINKFSRHLFEDLWQHLTVVMQNLHIKYISWLITAGSLFIRGLFYL
jgi:Na+-transporting NADH:ubiquinone oxidoreductase subunit NqrC